MDIVQFMKSGTSSEVEIFKKIPETRYWCPGKHPFIKSQGPKPVHFEHAAKALGFVFEAIERGTHLLICDEVLDTLTFNTLEKRQLVDLIKQCKNRIELVMTGRNAPAEIMELADYATEFVQVKHPYGSGAKARKGIEY